MLRSIWEDLKREFSYGNAVTRIILVNIGVFVVIGTVSISLYLASGLKTSPLFFQFAQYFQLPSNGWALLKKPWTVLLHMFSHINFFHILWNMMFYNMCGRIVGDLLGNKRILPIYLLGGLSGALMFILAQTFIIQDDAIAIGASAAIMATIVIAGVIAPEYIIRLVFIGDVKLKFIVVTLAFVDMVLISQADFNSGGLYGHLGGDLFGFIYAWQLRKGRDLAFPLMRFFDWWDATWARWRSGSPPRRGPKVAYKNPKVKEKTTAGRQESSRRSSNAGPRYDNMSHQEQLDAILDKIKQSGYESLSTDEKEFLFNASKK
jgi:membrane associated rhomboid family serine protease